MEKDSKNAFVEKDGGGTPSARDLYTIVQVKILIPSNYRII
jgi:hypothetical protein